MANKENVKKWVDALRSGKYSQTAGRLGDKLGFCCLGVACEVAMENGLPLKKELLNDEHGSIEYSQNAGELPDEVCEWLGFYDEGDSENSASHDSDPKLPTPEHPLHSCVSWNDEENANFAKIADLIEKEYLAGGD